MAYRLKHIRAIDPESVQALATQKIHTTSDLLSFCGTPDARRRVSQQTGISEHLLLRWANFADLMRVGGIGKRAAEILAAVGIDTLGALRAQASPALVAKMKASADGPLPTSARSFAAVARWIARAKKMKSRVF